ncbi:MAG: hypothetical protein K0R39_3047 [Symbiobacteriaceae bacterium]|jgi:type VI secretion system secreted protein Hcp|nr:hypothetical protein [Symbiobacteriaceae bacterium]
MFLKAKRSVGAVAIMAAAILALVFSFGGSAVRLARAEDGGTEGAQAAEATAATHEQSGHSTWMRLSVNGQEIEGDSYDRKREGQIEVLAFNQSVTTAREAGSGMATGRRQYQPLLIRKRIDKASPLLMKALTENSVVDATFGFYRPNPTGDGAEERFYEIEIRHGRVASVEIVMDEATGMPMEEITFVFQTIAWTYTNGGVTHEDTWSQQR